jgi:prepilin-type N-terminal cleavage/methylation domain-containing protein
MARKAFTLIEILITVTILGILAGVVIPMYRNATGGAFLANAQTFEKSLQSGSSLYLSKFKRVPTYFWNWVAFSSGGSDRNLVRVDGTIRTLLADPNANVAVEGNALELVYKNGLVARYVIDNNGKITATYTQPEGS